MFKKILVYVVCLVIGICLGEVIKHEVFPNTISTIPSGSSTATSVIDSSTIASDSNIANFIKQFNEFNTDTTCKIVNIDSHSCGSNYYNGSYSSITLKCYSTSNYSFPQNVDIFYKETSMTTERAENNQIVILSFTQYTNKHCVEKKD